uniref:Uncharacterized protein n=1 Tax=Lotharella globosa TaxID=91324 RepID=A0A7S3ZH49_9EUKA
MRDEISRLERGLSTSKAHTARYEQDLADIYSSTCGPSIIHTSSGGSGLLFHPASGISDTRPVSADGVRRSTYHPIMSQIDIKKMVLDKVSQLQHSLDDKSSELKELRTKFEERVKRDSERVSLLQAEVSRLSSEAHQRSIEHERDIEGTIADQNREVENCRVDLDIAREELQETQAALQRTQALLQAAEKSSEQQRLRADDLAKDLESNRKRLTDAEARSDGLAASAEAWKAKHIEFSKRVDDMAREIKNRADSSKMIMDQTTAKAKNAEKNEAKLREELKKAEGDARERIVLFEKQIENLTLKLQSVEANLADSKARERGERSRAEAAEKEASGLRGRLLEATEGGGKLLASAGAWEVKHQEQSRLIIRLEAEIESLKEVATLSKQNHSNQIEAARLEVQQAELKFAERMEEVKDLRTRLEASASAHKALEERRLESESLRAKISGLEGELHKTKAELNVVNERNKKISYDWEEKHSAAISRVAELTGEASRLSSEATRVRKEAHEGQEKLAKSLALAKAEARTQKEATNASKKEVSKLKEELKKAQEESLNSGEALRTTSEALSKSNNEIKTISSALTEAKASRDSVNSELAALRERLSQSEEGGGILQARHAVQLEKITELNQKLSSIKERNEKLETQLRETAEALKVAEANIKTGKQGEEKMSSEIQDLQHQLKQKTSELQTALLSSLSNKEAQASHEDVFQSRPFLGHRSTQSQPSGLNVEGEEARRVSEILKGLGIRHAFDDTDLNAELASKALIEAIRYSEQANANSTKDEANVILQVANLSKLTNAVVNTRRRLRSQLVAAHDLGRRLLGELVRLTSDVSVWWDRVISLVNDKRVTDEALRAKLKADGRPVWKAKIEQNLREARKEYEAQVDRERVGESKHQESNSMADMDTALDGLRVSLKLEEEIKALRLENTTLREQRKAILKKLKRYNAFYEQVKGSSATEKAKKARYVRRINQLQNRILELERMLKHSNETVAEHRQSLSQIMPADLMGDLTHSASVPNKGDGQRDEVYEELRSSLITQLDQNIRLKEKCRSLETENQRLLSLSHPSVRPALDQMHEEKLMLEQEHTHAKERLLKEMAITRLEFRKLKEERDQLKKEKALWESERRLLRNERTFEQGQNKAQRSQTLSKIKAVQEMMRMRVANLRALHKSFKDHVIQCISNATSDARRIVREEVGAMLRAQPSGEKETKMLHSILSAMESGDASQRRIIEDLQRSLEQMSEAYDSGVALAAPQLALASRQARKNASPSKRPLEDTGSLLRYQN